ncbi:anti-phage dCTP deaminase [Roseobacter sp. A03A-229]
MSRVKDAELVVGIVGRIGVDTKSVVAAIQRELHALHYTSKNVKLTDYLSSKEFEFELVDAPIDKRYGSRIDACNAIRERSGRADFFVAYAIQSIIEHRAAITDTPDVPASRTAYIIDQLKRPEEAEAFRSVYGKQFVLISCHLPIDVRQARLARLIAEGNASAPRADQWSSSAIELIDRDEKEALKPFGQRVSDVFPQADLIIDATDDHSMSPLLKRFFEALFGNFAVSPTREEFFQNVAHNVSLTSCDTARQVGAVIAKEGDIVTTGFNEAPKSFGGTYWADEGMDARDVALGSDINTVRKRQMVAEIVQILRDAGELKEETLADHEIEAKYLDQKGAPLKKSQIMDTLEYGRAVHAEMAALSSAARLGLKVGDGSLFCTTFPCHNCSKHIVASGISTVRYLEPYAKSYASELYPDSIQIDQSVADPSKVQFRQFIGITPVRFRSLFAKSKIKDSKGNIIEWLPQDAQPILDILDQAHISREIIFQKTLSEELDDDTAKYLGLAD